MSVTSSCLSNNAAPSGLIGLDATSTISTQNNFGLSNGDGTGCNGFLVDGQCNEFASSVCIAESRRCYTAWNDLATAVSNSTQPTVFSVCENSVLDASDGPVIDISVSGTQLRCGLDGSVNNNCVIFGGRIQIRISGTPTEIEIRGLTFLSASMAAISANGGRSSKAVVIDCVFAVRPNISYHAKAFATNDLVKNMVSGQAAILVYEGNLQRRLEHEARRRAVISDFVAPGDRSMSLDIQYCKFQVRLQQEADGPVHCAMSND